MAPKFVIDAASAALTLATALAIAGIVTLAAVVALPAEASASPGGDTRLDTMTEEFATASHASERIVAE